MMLVTYSPSLDELLVYNRKEEGGDETPASLPNLQLSCAEEGVDDGVNSSPRFGHLF